MVTFPVNAAVRSALNDWPAIGQAIENKLSLISWAEANRQMVRLLGNAENHRHLLGFINENAAYAGEIGKRLILEKDLFSFLQRLSELYLLTYLRAQSGVNATAAVSRPGKSNDVDLQVGTMQARIEVYCPVDF